MLPKKRQPKYSESRKFDIHFDVKVIRFLQKIPKDISEKIFRKMQSTKIDPYHFFERLSRRPEYKLRIGKFRVIATIDNKHQLIIIHMMGHRKNIYY